MMKSMEIMIVESLSLSDTGCAEMKVSNGTEYRVVYCSLISLISFLVPSVY